jgi:hypothetical protein
MKQETIKVKILIEYSDVKLIDMIPILENYYKFLHITELQHLNKLILKIKMFENIDIGNFTLSRLFNEYPFFILTNTSIRQYLLFLRIITGDSKIY